MRFFLLAVLVLVAYFHAFFAPFLWDDEVMVLGNRLIHDWGSIFELFQSSAFGNSMEQGKYYRPIQILSYLIDNKLFGLHPMAFHGMSVLYHMLTTFLLYVIACRIKCGEWGAFIVAALYAVHPINIEAVTYVSGRGDLLCILFALLSFYGFIRSFDRWLWAVPLTIGCYGVAILAKENALALPLMMTAYAALSTQIHGHRLRVSMDRITRWQWSLLGTWLTMIGYVSFRLLHTKVASNSLSWIAEASWFERVLTLPYLLLTYLKLLLVPYPLHMEYMTVIRSVSDPYVWLGVPALLVLVGVSWWLARRVTALKPYILLAWAWFLLGLGPVYHIPFPLPSTVREHWASLPFLGWYLLAAKIVMGAMASRSARQKRAIVLGCVLYLCILTGITIDRNMDWRDAERLYASDLRYEPNSFLLHNNLGLMYYRKGRFDEAEKAFYTAIQVSPHQSYGVAYNNLGVTAENKGRHREAAALFAKSIENSQYHLAYGNLGRLLMKYGYVDEARYVLLDGQSKYPYDPDIQRYLKALDHVDKKSL